MSWHFCETTRVQIPAMIHLLRLGYRYAGKIRNNEKIIEYDPDTNILLNTFKQQLKKLNPNLDINPNQILAQIKQIASNDDLGKSFYTYLVGNSPKFIDFDRIENNIFSFTAEMTYRNEVKNDAFRPDITLFINGLPLVFIEVKKPNKREGIIEEINRMNLERFPNPNFRRFFNITQLMIFSNNEEYSTEGGIVPIQGAFYCTGARKNAFFNTFKEKNPRDEKLTPFHKNYPYLEVDEIVEKNILTDLNKQEIRNLPEYSTSLDINTPTNRILTSLCSPTRLLFLLKYGIAFVNSVREVDGQIEIRDEKQIMRYQQLLASQAVLKKLEEGITSGIIWHTQGSGKTALSFYLTKILRDYFSRHNKVAKFYFIVDRIDLMEQASREFKARGLEVVNVQTREELMSQFKRKQSMEKSSGKLEITVVNIQKFEEDKEKLNLPSYFTNLQRVFIIDEAHRGYKPGGCFLSNLFEADKNAIKLALTGTPLLKKEVSSCKVFGEYIDTYYYKQSIEDGYTLRICREEIKTSWKEKLNSIYDKLETLIQKKSLTKEQIIEHQTYVKALAQFVDEDLIEFRELLKQEKVGGMVICETNTQAKRLYKFFEQLQKEKAKNDKNYVPLKSAVILYDIDTPEIRNKNIEGFKKNGTIDLLIVNNMLLTGFDAPRLKRLYLGRELRDHGLLQALTRVNRPFSGLPFGYIVDFADIKKNYEQINAAYLEELQKFQLNFTNVTDEKEITDKIDVMVDPTEIKELINEADQNLFHYDIVNKEQFSRQVTDIIDLNELYKLKRALDNIKDFYRLVENLVEEDVKNRIKNYIAPNLGDMLSIVKNRMRRLDLQERINGGDIVAISEALDQIDIYFNNIGSEELPLFTTAKELKHKLKNVVYQLSENEDQEDPEFISIREELQRVLNKTGIVQNDIRNLNETDLSLSDIVKKLESLNNKNIQIKRHYNDDIKLVRVHKRISEINAKRKNEKKQPLISFNEYEVVKVLTQVKEGIDEKIYNQKSILKHQQRFEKTVSYLLLDDMAALNIPIDIDDTSFIVDKISRQYFEQFLNN